MNKTIYNISAEYAHIFSELENNGGEFTEEIESVLAINKSELKVKALAYIPVLKSVDMEVKEIDSEIARLTALKKVRKGIIANMKERLKNALIMYEIDEIKTATNTINFRKSESVQINCDVQDLPNDLKVISTSVIPKTEIKKLLKAGREIEGIELVTNKNLQIK